MEVRDFVDVLHLEAEYLSLGALAWAACGLPPADLARLHLRVPLDMPTMKRRWLEAHERARGLVNGLPDQDVGCL